MNLSNLVTFQGRVVRRWLFVSILEDVAEEVKLNFEKSTSGIRTLCQLCQVSDKMGKMRIE